MLRYSLGCLLFFLPTVATAAEVVLLPGDDYTKLEAAQAGDTVLVSPGTYRFRVNFENAGTAAQPITIKAMDPSNRPVWDLGAGATGDAPGSYTAGDRGRGCWQFRGPHYRVDGIVFKGCKDHGGAGIRVVNVDDIQIRHCKFQDSTNGLTGTGIGVVVEHCEFDNCGKPYVPTDNAAHSMYIYGGTLAVRYSYFHDSPEGQHFHVRATDSVLEYNWFSRAGGYSGDIMTCNYLCGSTGTSPITQKMLLRGNVIVQGTGGNQSQLLALYNDEPNVDDTGMATAMDLTLVGNTIIGNTPISFTRGVVHMLNDSGIATHVHAFNNVVTNFKNFGNVEAPAMSNWTLEGGGNWLTTGTVDQGLTGTRFGADPQLGAGYVPQAGSPVLGGAVMTALAPVFEYYRDETMIAMGRARQSAQDLGAFEHDSASPPFNGYGAGGAGAGGAGAGGAGVGGGAAGMGGGGAGMGGGGAGMGGAGAGGMGGAGGAGAGGAGGAAGRGGAGAGGGGAGAAGSGGGAGAGGAPAKDSGCHTAPGRGPESSWLWIGVLALALVSRRRGR